VGPSLGRVSVVLWSWSSKWQIRTGSWIGTCISKVTFLFKDITFSVSLSLFHTLVVLRWGRVFKVIRCCNCCLGWSWLLTSIGASIGKIAYFSTIETNHGCFSWHRTPLVIGCYICWWWMRRAHTRIRASDGKVPFFSTIVAFLVQWALDCILIGLGWGSVSTKVRHWSQNHSLCWSPSLVLIGTLEGKVTSLSTESNLGNIGLRGWSWISVQYRSVRLMWIVAFKGKLDVLSIIVACLGGWNLCSTFISLHFLCTLIFNIETENCSGARTSGVAGWQSLTQLVETSDSDVFGNNLYHRVPFPSIHSCNIPNV
jgi:hypothetical protein